MDTVIIQDNHQLSLPTSVLQHFHLQPGQTLICIVKGNVINLIPKQDIQSVRGLLKGANTANYRDRQE